MDWKNNCVTSEACRRLARQFAAYAQEEFLVTLANKGLYKRAVKDCAALASCGLEAEGDALAVTLDGCRVLLQPNVAQSACSCPSKTVCKHILMALLCAAELAALPQETEAGESAQPTGGAGSPDAGGSAAAPDPAGNPGAASEAEEAFAALRKADPAELRKQAGKRVFEEALRLVQDGWTAELEEGEMLAATLPSDGVTVYFPREDSLRRAVCKCGEAGLCRHKLVALLNYRNQFRPLEPGADSLSIPALSEEALKLLRASAGFVAGLLEKGIASAGEGDVDAAVQYSLKLEAASIGNLARMFRSLGADLEHLQEKNAAFSQIVAFSTAARLYNTLRILVRDGSDHAVVASLVERTRSDYRTTPTGRFIGLGAYPWETRSGFFGITALLYHEEQGAVCSFTASMAGYYEKTAGRNGLQSLSAQMKHSAFWADGIPMASIAGCRLKLGNFKMNQQNRLSSAKQTTVSIAGKTGTGQVAGLPLARAAGACTVAAREYDYFGKRKSEEVVAVHATAVREAAFDRASQILNFKLEDDSGCALCALPYSELNQRAVERIEELARRDVLSERYFICLVRSGGLLPVSMVTPDGVDSFYFG